MRFAIVSGFGCSLSWWLRLQAEGHEVAVWLDGTELKSVGDGLVFKVGTFDALKAWGQREAIYLFDASGMGDKADELIRAGYHVVGGGKFMDRLEKDRTFGFKIAQDAGAFLPPYEEFESFEAALAFASEMEELPVYFKSDRYLDADATHGADSRDELIEYLEYIIRTYGSHGRCILQEKLKGTAISTARWWNGRDWVGPFQFTIEHKKFLNDDVGPSTGCCFNAVWFSEEATGLPEALGWHRLGPLFLAQKAPPGLYDINALVTPDGQAYFLEWTPRLGYDSEMTSFRLFPNLGEWLSSVALGRTPPPPKELLSYSVRLGIPPYPWEHVKKTDRKTCIGTPIHGELGDGWSGNFIAYQLKSGEHVPVEMASAEGIVGLVYAEGDNLSSIHEEVIEAAKALRVPGLSYRTDGDKVISKDAKEIKKAGFAVHPGLLVE